MCFSPKSPFDRANVRQNSMQDLNTIDFNRELSYLKGYKKHYSIYSRTPVKRHTSESHSEKEAIRQYRSERIKKIKPKSLSDNNNEEKPIVIEDKEEKKRVEKLEVEYEVAKDIFKQENHNNRIVQKWLKGLQDILGSSPKSQLRKKQNVDQTIYKEIINSSPDNRKEFWEFVKKTQKEINKGNVEKEEVLPEDYFKNNVHVKTEKGPLSYVNFNFTKKKEQENIKNENQLEYIKKCEKLIHSLRENNCHLRNQIDKKKVTEEKQLGESMQKERTISGFNGKKEEDKKLIEIQQKKIYDLEVKNEKIKKALIKSGEKLGASFVNNTEQILNLSATNNTFNSRMIVKKELEKSIYSSNEKNKIEYGDMKVVLNKMVKVLENDSGSFSEIPEQVIHAVLEKYDNANAELSVAKEKLKMRDFEVKEMRDNYKKLEEDVMKLKQQRMEDQILIKTLNSKLENIVGKNYLFKDGYNSMYTSTNGGETEETRIGDSNIKSDRVTFLTSPQNKQKDITNIQKKILAKKLDYS